MFTNSTSPQPTRPAQLDHRDFPTYHAYQTARRRELNRARVRNMRLTNPHLSLDGIANATGVPHHEIRAALDPDLTIGPPTPS